MGHPLWTFPKKTLKNYRPVSLLAVAGMILEKVVALQIEEFFESNGLLGNFGNWNTPGLEVVSITFHNFNGRPPFLDRKQHFIKFCR